MKNISAIILLLTLSLSVKSQTLKEYKASNGLTYKKKDTIVMSEGSGYDDTYKYLWIRGGGKINTVAYQGIKVVIKKIKRFKNRGTEKVLFSIGGGNIINYTLDIEGAISSCEIKNCIKDRKDISLNDKYDKLAKIKKLFDEGILTKEEYESEKKKILKN
tara:strand:- start:3966 stop:4445 length:480 start_codon:yes stop_codon:yes gene_type:complete